MQSRIETLPVEVVHLIAAGEVIDSLAAVVRELTENALDAGATRISISIYPEQWRVRIADNGSGMGLEDLKKAASPHTTSKIYDWQDLGKITSLGFRGEALHSLAQLANLEIISHSSDRDEGWRVIYNAQGEAVEVTPAAIAPGTVVIADNIFGNWSTRRAGLPSLAQQMKAVQSVIYQMALCHPHVSWQVQQDDRDWFNLWMGKTARHILPQILRDVQVGDLQELSVQLPSFEGDEGGRGDEGDKGEGDRGETLPSTSPSAPPSPSTPSSPPSPPSLYLLLGLPDRCHRHRPDWIRVAVNGRFVQLPELEQTILAGFRQTLPRDRFPVCIVHLQIPPHQIDWNRHPAKSEIYLHHLADWREQVTKAIEKALQVSSVNLSDTLYADRASKVLRVAETENRYNVKLDQEPEDRSQEPEFTQNISYGNATRTKLKTQTPLSLRAIAQVHNMYILAEHPTGVWLIEQHIAHERVLYEQLCDRWQMVSLESPIVLNQLSTAQVEQLQKLEIDIEAFGEQAWVVRTAPEMLAWREDCAEALLELSLGGDLQAAQVATACRSAIRNGNPLSLEEMQNLLNQWQQTRNPRTCPHGRPICLSLEESALSRFFRRHWVIGKSHGI